MTAQKAGDRVVRLLLPYRVRDHGNAEGPDHEVGWWFRAAPPEVIREALTLAHRPPGANHCSTRRQPLRRLPCGPAARKTLTCPYLNEHGHVRHGRRSYRPLPQATRTGPLDRA
jgi:hypothetical protein